MRSFQDSNIEMVLVVGKNSELHGLEKLATVVRSSLLDWQSLPFAMRSKIKTWFGRDYLLYALLRWNKIDVLSHSGVLWPGCKIKSLPWIPDFQHKYYPEFFDAAELGNRDKAFELLASTADAVLCSSQSAANDLKKYCSPVAEPRVLRFVVAMPESIPAAREDLISRYKLTQAWFHLPNQLWKHKNHEVVIDALRLLKERGQPVPLVVVTGPTGDRRNPGHFQYLQQKLKDNFLQTNFIILGKVPYEDMVGLMYHSIAIINPSLFEGWSTTVEESKSLGKKVILSDIDVHVEQQPQRGVYFKSGNAEDLAGILQREAQSYDPLAEPSLMRAAAAEMEENRRTFAACYKDIVFGLFGS